MKGVLIGNSKIKFGASGISTIEILIALAILILCVSAASLVVFGNQDMVLDAQASQEALYIAEQNLLSARKNATLDYNSLISTQFEGDGFYKSELHINDLTPCSKHVNSRVGWWSRFRNLNVELSTVVNGFNETVLQGYNCPEQGPVAQKTTEWSNPVLNSKLQIKDFNGQITDFSLFSIKGQQYVFLSAISGEDQPEASDFWILEISGSDSKIVSILNTGLGIHAFKIARLPGEQYFAFIATNSTEYPFAVINLNDLASPVVETTQALPGMTKGVGRSIYYYNERVYIGTQYLACPNCLPSQNNELHIFKLGLSDEFKPEWEASIKVNRNVNQIIVRQNYAYLATGPGSNKTPFKIFNLNPESENYLKEVGTLITLSNTGQGQALYLLGQKIYFGLASGNPNFYILDVSEPEDLKIVHTFNTSAEVKSTIVYGPLIFVGIWGSNPRLQIYNFINSDSSTLLGSIPIAGKIQNLNYDHQYLYLALEGEDILNIIHAQP